MKIKTIKNFPNYKIDEFGNIYMKNGKIKSVNINNMGYKVVSLSNNGNRKYFLVHRLVAISFILNPDNLPIVNHIDTNTLNNHIDNLEWCTHKQNMEHASMHNLMNINTQSRKGETNGNSKLTNNDVNKIKELSNTGVKTKNLAKLFKVNISTINRIKRNANWKHL